MLPLVLLLVPLYLQTHHLGILLVLINIIGICSNKCSATILVLLIHLTFVSVRKLPDIMLP